MMDGSKGGGKSRSEPVQPAVRDPENRSSRRSARGRSSRRRRPDGVTTGGACRKPAAAKTAPGAAKAGPARKKGKQPQGGEGKVDPARRNVGEGRVGGGQAGGRGWPGRRTSRAGGKQTSSEARRQGGKASWRATGTERGPTARPQPRRRARSRRRRAASGDTRPSPRGRCGGGTDPDPGEAPERSRRYPLALSPPAAQPAVLGPGRGAARRSCTAQAADHPYAKRGRTTCAPAARPQVTETRQEIRRPRGLTRARGGRARGYDRVRRERRARAPGGEGG